MGTRCSVQAEIAGSIPVWVALQVRLVLRLKLNAGIWVKLVGISRGTKNQS